MNNRFSGKRFAGIQEINFSKEAIENIEATGADFEEDFNNLMSGKIRDRELLEFCLDGAEPEYIQGWDDYVMALSIAVDKSRASYRVILDEQQSIQLVTENALDMSPKKLTDDVIEEYADCLAIEVRERGQMIINKEAVRSFLRNRRGNK